MITSSRSNNIKHLACGRSKRKADLEEAECKPNGEQDTFHLKGKALQEGDLANQDSAGQLTQTMKETKLRTNPC
jgi:hypothetical protein